MQIRAVTFDVGGTLIEPWPSVGHVYAEVAAQHGLKGISAEVLQSRFKEAWHSARDFNNSRAGWEQLVDEVFLGLAPEPPSRTFFSRLYERFAQADVWRVYDDVFPALDSLASDGIRLAVISNWDERLRGLLRLLKLHDYFETLAISCEVGFSKPSPVIFEHAAEKLGLPPGAVLHVGDSLEMDVHGGRSAGFHACRIRRAKGSDPHDIQSLTNLPATLVKLSGSAIR